MDLNFFQNFQFLCPYPTAPRQLFHFQGVSQDKPEKKPKRDVIIG